MPCPRTSSSARYPARGRSRSSWTRRNRPSGKRWVSTPSSEADRGQGRFAPSSGTRGIPDMLKERLRIVAAGLVVVGSWGLALGQSETIEKIVVDGNVRISTPALMSQLTLKEGDPYDEEALRREFTRLWDLNLFDNITLEVR